MAKQPDGDWYETIGMLGAVALSFLTLGAAAWILAGSRDKAPATCPNCGSTIPHDSNPCPVCRTPLEWR